MQTKPTPTEGKNSAKLEAESALRGAACCASLIPGDDGDLLASKIALYRGRVKRITMGLNIIEGIAEGRTEEERDALSSVLKIG